MWNKLRHEGDEVRIKVIWPDIWCAMDPINIPQMIQMDVSITIPAPWIRHGMCSTMYGNVWYIKTYQTG